MRSFAHALRRAAAFGIIPALAPLVSADMLPFVEVPVDDAAGQPLGLAVADVDGDGDNDIVAATFGAGIWWYENMGGVAPAFVKRNIAGALQPWAVIAADVEHDGDIDVVSVSETGVRRHFNSGTFPPGWNTNQLVPMAQGQHIISADINRDGALDLVVASTMTNEVVLYQNTGGMPPNFARMTLPGAPSMPCGVAAGDLDSDGDLDIAAVSQGDNTLAWYRTSGVPTPGFTRFVISGGMNGVRTVGLGDLDSDGDLDIAASSDTAWGTWIFLNNGAPSPTFNLHMIVPEFAEEIQVVDLDRDGDLDILAAQKTDGELIWLDNNGASPPGFVTRSVWGGAGMAAAVAAPINGDGALDIVISISDEGRIVLLRGVGAGAGCFGDLNGDGVVSGLDIPVLLGQWGGCP